MPQTAAIGAASIRASITKFMPPLLALLVVACIPSLCVNAVQGSPLVPKTEKQELTDSQSLTKALRDSYSPEAREYRRRVACRRACWAKYVPEYADCLKDTTCYQCYMNCAIPPFATTITTTTSAPTTTPVAERHQFELQQQHHQSQQSSKINKSIQETWPLHTVSMLQQDSLVLVDIAWEALNTPNQCLISWEVSGGGLMGNLLTESSNVQLSLWPDTKYRVKVTCKNKLTGFMSRSLPLSIDTSEAVNVHEHLVQNRTQSSNADTSPISTTTTAGSKIYPPYKPEQQQQQPQQISNSAFERIDSGNSEDNNSVGSHGYVAEVDNAAVLPYDEHDEHDEHDDEQDQSAETLNQHTNFIFNWHAKNSDISAIEPLQKPDINVLTIATLADLQKPLLFGLIAGTLMITLVLITYRCTVVQQRLAVKDMLINDDEVHAVVVSMPPAVAAARANNKAAARKAMEGGRSGCGGGAQGATSLAYQRESDEEEEYGRNVEQVCSNPAICSRNALKV